LSPTGQYFFGFWVFTDEKVIEAHWIGTSNADVNASMLKVNYEMGYKPCEVTALWRYHFP
jgi:hypothetical protein